MEKYRVSSISEYLAILENKNMSDYIYRGQNEPYYSIQASGFRPYTGSWQTDKIYDMQNLQLDFKNKILGKLSEDEKKYFLAFCQHHGIPTNLVDVSYSPLVSLFFACDGKGEKYFSLKDLIENNTINELENSSSLQNILIHNLLNAMRKTDTSKFAQIYAIKKERLIDITDIIIALDGENFFEHLLENNDLKIQLYYKLKEHFAKLGTNTITSYIKNILNSYKNIICDDFSNAPLNDNYYEIIELIDEISNEYTDIQCENLLSILENNAEFNISNYFFQSKLNIEEVFIPTKFHLIYTYVLLEILNILKTNIKKTDINLDIYFIYQIPEIFGRISSQQGFFIYQSYLFTNDNVYDYCELNTQSIEPDIIIEIDNYKNIFNELNILGINHGTIYGDLDNVAKAILKFQGKLLKA